MVRLKELRKEKGLTQGELSKILKISPSAIGMYEQGRRCPDNETLLRIAQFFHVSLDYLLGRELYDNQSYIHGNKTPLFQHHPKEIAELIAGYNALDEEGRKRMIYTLKLEKMRMAEDAAQSPEKAAS